MASGALSRPTLALCNMVAGLRDERRASAFCREGCRRVDARL